MSHSVRRLPSRRFATLLVAALLAAAWGCGGNQVADYVPSPDAARNAVETVLKAWQAGDAYGPLTKSKPAINVFEARWQAGKKLESFEILEEVTGQEHPQFQVRLKLAGAQDETETYRVVGIDPLNVFREADYRRATGM
jgi:hypothetical protein